MTITGRTATLLVGGLILSVCINLFAAAMLAGHWAWGPRERVSFGIGRMIAAAPEPARPVLRQHFEGRRADFAERSAAVREARRRIADLMRRGDAAPGELEAAFAEFRRLSAEAQALVHGTLLQSLNDLSPDVRAAWADAWTAPRPRGEHGRGRRD